MFVLRELAEAGGGEEITYSVGAHLGTDKLKSIVKKIREKIISLGGEFRFNTRLDQFIVKNGRAVGAVVTEKNGLTYEISSSKIILAIGHSSRDTFRAIKSQGIHMTPRGFGIGMRIEHPREYINELVYGKSYAHDLGTASYHLVTHLENGRSVYSFCMCPGGEVVAATGNEGCIVTNGMSEYHRMADNSNAAYLVSVTPDDFGSDDPLAGFDLQEKIEKRAFSLTENYKDYYEAKDYGDLYADYADDIEEYPTEEYSNDDYDNDDDSWNDSNWDDDDWDYDWDDYDSYDSDWDSDW
jgi:uncharacterized FAD-dependent dehydrogenase